MQGDQSFWKALFRWGENYQGVVAHATSSNFTVNFSRGDTTMPDFQGFW